MPLLHVVLIILVVVLLLGGFPTGFALIVAAMAAESVIPTVAAATDFTGLAALAMAFSALLAAVGVMVVNIMNARTARKMQEAKDAREAEDRKEIKDALKATVAAAEFAAAKAEAAKNTMDGGLAQLIRKVEQGGEAQGKANEKEAQAGRDQAASDATAVEEERARKLVKDAVATTPAGAPRATASPLGTPVPVEVVNAGDTSLKVTEQEKKP